MVRAEDGDREQGEIDQGQRSHPSLDAGKLCRLLGCRCPAGRLHLSSQLVHRLRFGGIPSKPAKKAAVAARPPIVSTRPNVVSSQSPKLPTRPPP